MRSLRSRHRVSAALFVVLAAMQADACSQSRGVMELAPGVQLGYESLGPQDSATPTGRVDGSVATLAGVLRSTVRTAPNEERRFQRGDTSFELANAILGGQLLLREPEAGGAGAAWSGKLGTGLAAKTQGERTPVRSAQALQLQQQLVGGYSAQASLFNSRTTTAQGLRQDLEIAKVSGLSRWNAGVEAAGSGYVSAAGAAEPRGGVRVGTQWPLLPQSRLELRYARQLRWNAPEPVSTVMVGTRFDLPRHASLATVVETDAEAHHKASLTLTVPLEAR